MINPLNFFILIIYEVICGRRRYEAAKQAGLKDIPCVIVDVSDEEAVTISLIENIQRNNLTEREIAETFLKIREVNPRYTYKDFAGKVGISRTYLHDILTAYNVFKILKKKGLAKGFKAKPSDEECVSGVFPISQLKDIGYAAKKLKDKLPEEDVEEKVVKLGKEISGLPSELSKDIIIRFKENPEKPVKEIVADAMSERYVPPKESVKKDARVGYMKVTDAEHSIFNYIDYFIDLFKKNRKGLKNYVERLELRKGKLIIHFKGYDESLDGMELSMRHEYRRDRKDMVTMTIREDKRPLIEILKADLDSEERSYTIAPPTKEEETEKPSIEFPIPRKTEKVRQWRIVIENRNKLIDISYGIRDRYKRAVWNRLVNAPFRILSEKDIIMILRSKGLSKENAYNLMNEIKEEWLEEGWIEVV